MVLNYFFDDSEVNFDVQLVEHIEEKNDQKVKLYLQNSKDLHKAVDTSGSSLLHYAAKCGNETIASHLIKLGFKVNLQNKDGETPLSLATKGQHASTIKVLLESDADMYIHNSEDINALQMALQSSPTKVEIAQMYLDQLISDCSSDSAEIARKLMKMNCPFYVAVLAKDEAVLRYMLSGCWSINAKDPSSGKTALHVAVENLDLKLVKLLLHFGANVNVTDALNKTPLAMLKNCDDEFMSILQYLLEFQSDLTLCDEDGFMQMHWILKNGSPKAVEKILKFKFDMSTTDENKQNIFHYLAKNVDDKVVDLIDGMEIMKKVNPNTRDKDGTTPLHFAMDAGNAKFVCRFYEHLPKNIANHKGITPFLQAIESTSLPTSDALSKDQTRLECVKALMMFRVNPDILLGQYFKIYNTKSAIKRDLALLEPVVAMLVICKADGKLINQDVLDRITTYPLLKEYYDLCANMVDKMKSDMISRNTSLFDCVASKTEYSYLKIISFIRQDWSVDSKMEKYKSISIYYNLLRAYWSGMFAYYVIPMLRLLAGLYSFLFYQFIKLWLYSVGDDDGSFPDEVDDDDGIDWCLSENDSDCFILYHKGDKEQFYYSDLCLITIFVTCTFVLCALYDRRKHVIKLLKNIF